MANILVIDDDELIRMTMRGALKKMGHNVTEAKNGHEGLALFKQDSPDLVITDILMPDKEGLETISDIRACNPDAKIIAMSGGGSSKNMAFLDLAKQMGATQILEKPIRPDELSKAVVSVLNG